MASSFVSPANPVRTLQLAWNLPLSSAMRGLTLARERVLLLVWDDQGNLILLNRHGARQAHRPFPSPVAVACAADDGSAYVAMSPTGEICWLAPDLTQRWQKASAYPLWAAALDPFGQYLATVDTRGKLHVLDRHGRRIMSADSPRPLHHLAFVPGAPFLVAAADFGLVVCFDFTGKMVWRAGLVAHVGSLAVSGDGSVLSLACFTEGVQRYDLTGKSLGRLNPGEPCRLAALTIDGNRTLAAGLGKRLLLFDRDGRVLLRGELAQPCVSLALAALGEMVYVGLPDGQVQALQLS